MIPTAKQSNRLKTEQLTENFAEQRGPILVAQNYRYRFSEINLIAEYGKTLAFIGIRLHRNNDF